MIPNQRGVPSETDLDAARLLLARLGIQAEDLLGSPASPLRSDVPTFSEYVPVVAAAISDSTRRIYGHYWRRVVEHWGDRRIDEVTPSEIQQLVAQLRADRVVRRHDRGGMVASESLIGALRCLYRHAIADRCVDDNPALRVPKPRRAESTRHALAPDRLAEIVDVASSTGDDPALDALLIRMHIETACRRGGALALRPCDLDEQQCMVLLREKNHRSRLQPVSPTLMTYLLAFIEERGALATEQLLRYRGGRPITGRRYDYLWMRVGKTLPWVAAQGITAHWLRHTTLTWVERNFGYAIAQKYAGHAAGLSRDGATATYVRATLPEVAEALSAMVGEPHPLAPGQGIIPDRQASPGVTSEPPRRCPL